MKVSRILVPSCLLAFALCQTVIASNHPRQLVPPPSESTASQPANTNTGTTQTTPASSTPTTTTAQSTNSPSTATTTTTSSQTTASSAPSTTAPSATSPPPTPSDTALSTTADPGAVTVTQTSTATSSSDTATPTNTQDSNDSSGLGIGPIIGMSVAGGIAVIAIIAFFIWKFTRKRFSAFDDSMSCIANISANFVLMCIRRRSNQMARVERP